jgi:Chloroplast envelope transporter
MADAVALACVQTFQKLIFISNLVFGDQKAAFLLPWRRTFNLTDSQLAIAKRDSAKALFKSFLDERGGFQARHLTQRWLQQKIHSGQTIEPRSSATRCVPAAE